MLPKSYGGLLGRLATTHVATGLWLAVVLASSGWVGACQIPPDEAGRVTIPASWTEIPGAAFEDCAALRSITIPSTMTGSIGNRAFKGCSNLESVDIAEGASALQHEAFEDCIALRSVSLPDSITMDPMSKQDIFKGCAALEFIRFPVNLQEIPWGFCWGCSSLTTIIFPQNLNTISQHAFRGCGQLERIDLPATLGTVYIGAFADCVSLRWMSIPAPTIINLRGPSFTGALGCGNASLYVPGNTLCNCEVSTHAARTCSPTASPTASPSASPTTSPSVSPSSSPTTAPTLLPTTSPSMSPSASPTTSPSTTPTVSPSTNAPSHAPTTPAPTPDLCNVITCPRLCNDECGWSRSAELCATGLHTDPDELSLGYGCPPDADLSGSASKDDDAGGDMLLYGLVAVAGCVVLVLFVVAVRRCSRTGKEVHQHADNRSPGPAIFNQAFSLATTIAPFDSGNEAAPADPPQPAADEVIHDVVVDESQDTPDAASSLDPDPTYSEPGEAYEQLDGSETQYEEPPPIVASLSLRRLSQYQNLGGAGNATTVEVTPPTPTRKAQPTGRCTYTSGDGRRCIQKVAQGSDQCTQHTCNVASCTQQKSSKADHCDAHANLDIYGQVGGSSPGAKMIRQMTSRIGQSEHPAYDAVAFMPVASSTETDTEA